MKTPISSHLVKRRLPCGGLRGRVGGFLNPFKGAETRTNTWGGQTSEKSPTYWLIQVRGGSDRWVFVRRLNRRENDITVLGTLKSGCCFAFYGVGHLRRIDSYPDLSILQRHASPSGLICVEKEPHCSSIMSPNTSKLWQTYLRTREDRGVLTVTDFWKGDKPNTGIFWNPCSKGINRSLKSLGRYRQLSHSQPMQNRSIRTHVYAWGCMNYFECRLCHYVSGGLLILIPLLLRH